MTFENVVVVGRPFFLLLWVNCQYRENSDNDGYSSKPNEDTNWKVNPGKKKAVIKTCSLRYCHKKQIVVIPEEVITFDH